MRITVIAVGKIKEKYFTGAIAEYAKRLSRYCKLEIIELPDEKTPDGASAAQEQQIKEKEGDRILKAIREDAYVVALAIEGQKMTSEKLAAFIEKRGIAVSVPKWDAEKCVQCNQCAFVCPHATIRPFALTAEEAAAAPLGLMSAFCGAPITCSAFPT